MSIISELRSVKIFKIALFDLIMSCIGLFYLLKLAKPGHALSFYISWVVVLVLPISIVSHVLFHVPTMLNYYLGLSGMPVKN